MEEDQVQQQQEEGEKQQEVVEVEGAGDDVVVVKMEESTEEEEAPQVEEQQEQQQEVVEVEVQQKEEVEEKGQEVMVEQDQVVEEENVEPAPVVSESTASTEVVATAPPVAPSPPAVVVPVATATVATAVSSVSFFSRLTSKVSESMDSAKASATSYRAAVSTAVSTAAIKAKAITRDNSPLKRVTVEIQRAKNLVAMGENGRSDPFIMLELGPQVRKTNTVFRTLDPVFKEIFELSTRSKSAVMRCTVLNTDLLGLHDSMGYFDIDIGLLPIGTEYHKWCPITKAPPPNKRGVKKNKKREMAALAAGKEISVGEGPGEILIAISVSELYEHDLSEEDKIEAMETSCGWLKVHVMESARLPSNKALSCDPFCTVRVGNKTFRTDSIKGTSSPKWDSFFELPVKDIFDVVEIDILNEDRTGESDYLGGIMVPLLQVQSNSMQWYALKKEDHIAFLDGEPAVRVAFHLSYSIPKGALSVFKKRDARHVDDDPPFSLPLMRANAERLKAIAMQGVDAAQKADQAANFEFGLGFNVGVLVGWILFWILFDLYMIPLAAALGIIARGVILFQQKNAPKQNAETVTEDGKGTGDDKKTDTATAEKDDDDISSGNNDSMLKNIRKLLKMRNLLQTGQNLLQDAFDLVERVDNLTNWSHPIFASVVAITMFSSTVVLYFLPMRLVPILAGLGVFGRISLLHYLPELKKGPKDGLGARVHELVHAVPPPTVLLVQTFMKIPSNTDLKRRANRTRTDLPVAEAIKIQTSLEEDRTYLESLNASKKTN